MKDKAISKKIEIAKLLTEIYKHNGNIGDALNDAASTKGMSFDFSKIREIVNKEESNTKNKEIIEKKDIDCSHRQSSEPPCPTG